MGSIMVFRMRTPSTPGAMNLIVIIILLLLSCGCRNCSATSPDVDGCQNSTNPTLVGALSHIKGVWNRSTYGASSFRNDAAKKYFQVWPEDLRFQYFCEDGKASFSLTNFTYSCTEGQLDPRPYYDVGTADNHQPYYKNWYYWRYPVKQLSYPIWCEYNDIRRLYVHRFWWEMMVPASIASAVMIIILEGAVVAFNYMRFKAPLHIQKWRSDGSSPTESVRDQSFRKILRVGIIDTIADCIHIVLLIAVGFGMIEAVGHSDLHSWRVRCFYNFGVIYTYLTLLAVASSFFRQLANSVTASSNDLHSMFRKQMSTQQEADAPNLPPGTVYLDGRIASIKTPRFVRIVDELHKLTTGKATTSEQDKDLPDLLAQKVEKLYKMSTAQQQPWEMANDWRWQRIFGQFAVLILLGTFLCFVDSDNGTALETLAGILLATVVAASIWSGGVSVVLLGSSVWHIAKQIYKRYRMRTKVTRLIPNKQQAAKTMGGLGTIVQFIARRRGRNGTPSRTGALSKENLELVPLNQEDEGALSAEKLLYDVESQNDDDKQPEIREVDSVASFGLFKTPSKTPTQHVSSYNNLSPS